MGTANGSSKVASQDSNAVVLADTLKIVVGGELGARDLSDGEAGKIKVVGRHKTDSPNSSTRGAVEDIFTVLAHSDGCLVCAGPAAHRQRKQ